MRTFMILGLVFMVLVSGLGVASSDTPAEREAFEVDDRKAFILAPAKPAEADQADQADPAGHGKPWVWYAPTFDRKLPAKEEQWMFDQLFAKGIAVAGVDVGESMGNPEGRAVYQKLYEQMVKRGYSTRPVLLARSRGGLMLYNWAAEHPDSVGGIAGVYPVCNLASYPGMNRAAKAFGMTVDELTAVLPEHNPIDRLEPLAKAKVPIRHIHGDNDRVVPLDKNTGLLAERYKALGGEIVVEVVKDGGHDMKSHWFKSQPLVDFMIDKALPGGDKDADGGAGDQSPGVSDRSN